MSFFFLLEERVFFLISRDVVGYGEYSSPYLHSTGLSIFPEERLDFLWNFVPLALDKVVHSMMHTASLGACEENHIY